MDREFDVVLVGSGHNGLIAAGYLAKSGLSVLVLEQNDTFGGGVATDESVATGFHHDLHSATHILIQANPLIRNDELGLQAKYGLKYIYPDAVFSTIFDDQSHIVTYGDLERTCASIGAVSPQDGENYRCFAAVSAGILSIIVEGAFVPPPPQGPFWALLDQSPQGQTFMSALQKSILDIVREWFTDEKVMIHMLKMAAEGLVAPEEKGTGILLYTLPSFVHAYPSGVPQGGSGALVSSLVRCLEDHGAELQTGSTVEKFISENSRVTGVRLVGGETIGVRKAVIGMIHPWLLPEMVDGLEDQLVANAKGTTTASFAIMAGHYALEEPPQYHAGPEPGKAALVNFAPARMEQFLRIFDDFRYGDILQKDSIMAAHEHTQFDPGLAPPGKATYTVFGFAPFELRDSGADGWDRHCDDVGDWLTAQLHHYIPNMEGGNILASLFESPLDMRRRSPTFQGADVGGVGKYLHQFGGHRPTPELAQFAVPGADGLYLAGTFMHPAGGVTGGGRATAVKICDDLGIDFDGLTR